MRRSNIASLRKILHHFIFFLLIFCPLQLSYAQNGTTKVSGRILDSLFMPIEYATIQLFSLNDSNLHYGAIGREDGTFLIKDVRLGVYRLKAGALGYKVESKDIDLSKPKLNTAINLIILKTNPIAIEEIKIKGLRLGYTEKVDKTLFVPDSIMLTNSKTGLDVLNKLPEIRVDKKDRSISLLGNKNILVLINGLDNKMDLDLLKPEDIERIEIITHPSVKYDSDIASVINVILKGHREVGFNVNGGMYYCMDKKNHSGNLQVNYQSNNWRFYGSYIGRLSENISMDTTSRKDIINQSVMEYRNIPMHHNIANIQYHSLFFGMEYTKNDHNLFSLTSKINMSKYNSFRNRKALTFLDTELIKSSFISSEYTEDKTEENYSFSYIHKFRKEEERIQVQANLYFLENTSKYDIWDTSFFYLTNSPSVITRMTSGNNDLVSIKTKVDYIKPFSDELKMETGGQFFIRKLNDEIRATYDIPSLIEYMETRYSLYSNLTWNYKLLNFQGGFRLERFHTNVNEVQNSQIKLLPYAAAMIALGSEHSIKLTYRKELSYPGYQTLNPFKFYSSDSMSYQAGNPYLRPVNKNMINLKYTFRKRNTYVSGNLYFNHLDDLIDQTTHVENQLLAFRYDNVGKAQQSGVNFSFLTTIADWLEFETEINAFYTNYPEHKKYNGLSYMIDYGFIIPLPLGFDMEIYGLLGEKEIEYNGYTKYTGYIDEISFLKDITDNFFIGLSVWQPFFKVTDTNKQWNDTFHEVSQYQQVKSTSFLIYMTWNFKSGKKLNKIPSETYMESNESDNKSHKK